MVRAILIPDEPLCPDDSGRLETEDGYDYVCKTCGKTWEVWELGESVEVVPVEIGPEDAEQEPEQEYDDFPFAIPEPDSAADVAQMEARFEAFAARENAEREAGIAEIRQDFERTVPPEAQG